VASRERQREGRGKVNVPYASVDAALEAYVIYLRDGYRMANYSRKYQLAVLRSSFETVNR
jgi:hypothetical protein